MLASSTELTPSVSSTAKSQIFKEAPAGSKSNAMNEEIGHGQTDKIHEGCITSGEEGIKYN